MKQQTKLMGVLSLVLSLGAGNAPTAVEQLKQLRERSLAAKKSGHMPARMRALDAIEELLNHSPQILETKAVAYASMGDEEHALAELETFAAMGQADDAIAKEESFAKMRELPRFRKLQDRMAENVTPVQHAETAFILADAGLLAEDMDYDPSSKSYLITSVLEKKIVRVDEKGNASDLAASPSGWPMLAIKVDAGRRLVWATEVALSDVEFVAKQDWGKSAVLCFDLQTGKLLRRVDAPPNAQLGDMVLRLNGDPIVSDGAGGGVFEVIEGKLQTLDTTNFISPQTPTMAPDGKQVFVPDYSRGIGVLDLGSNRVTWLKGADGQPFALQGIDGLYFDRGTLIATQNGSSPERVVRFRLNAKNDVVSEEVIERATVTLGDPTHGVVVGTDFYYIANSGWNYLDDHGVVKAVVKREPPRVMRFKLSAGGS